MQPELFNSESPVQGVRKKRQPQEWKVISLRECPMPDMMHLCDRAEIALNYWRTHIVPSPQFNAECECFLVLLLNVRKRIKGHHLVSIGTLDTILVHPREVFRVAVMAAAANIVLMHNLCAATHNTITPVAIRLRRNPTSK